MLRFESDEYWLQTTWDRFEAVAVVPPGVRKEFLRQEALAVHAVAQLVGRRVDESVPLRVLDLGCGTGRLSALLLKALGEEIQVTLLDFNPATLSRASQNLSAYANTTFVLSSLYAADKAVQEAFDCVLCFDILHHLADLPGALDVMKHLLTPHGSLVANVFTSQRYREWDVLKYGTIRSLARRGLSRVAAFAYSVCPRNAQEWIRRSGVGRIEPVDEGWIVALLEERFEEVDSNSGYYFWFQAKTRKGGEMTTGELGKTG